MSIFRSRSGTVTTTGTAGMATGSATVGVAGTCKLLALKLDYHASAPATTVITLKDSDGITLCASAAGNTDGYLYPRTTVQDETGTDAAAGDNLLDNIVLHGTVTIEVSASDALDPAVTVTLFTEE